jgi:DNA polymerase III delta prime subunit
MKGPSISLKEIKHHAYYIVGDVHTLDAVREFLHRQKIDTEGNADYSELTYNNFSIDDTRELTRIQEIRPTQESKKKVFVITLDSITVEAQNALLKLVEEPATYTVFFFIIPSAHILLPTVKSRMIQVDIVGGATRGDIAEAEKFLALSLAKRMEYAKSLVEAVSKEKKSKQDVIDFLSGLELTIHDKKGPVEGKTELEAILLAKKYAGDRSPSLKMLVEYVAIVVG